MRPCQGILICLLCSLCPTTEESAPVGSTCFRTCTCSHMPRASDLVGPFLRLRGGATITGAEAGGAMTRSPRDAWGSETGRGTESLAKEMRESCEKRDAMRRKRDLLSQNARTMHESVREMDAGSFGREGMGQVRRIEDILMESASGDQDSYDEELADTIERHSSLKDDLKGRRRSPRGVWRGDGPKQGQGRGMNIETKEERLSRLKRELEELEEGQGEGEGGARERPDAENEVEGGKRIEQSKSSKGGGRNGEDAALLEELDDGVWGALSSFSVSEQDSDDLADGHEFKQVEKDWRKAAALERQDEDLEKGMPALVRSMAKEFDEAGYMRYQCSFCPRDFEGFSSYMSTWRHVWSQHRNFLLCDDIAEEAARQAREKEEERRRTLEEEEQGKQLQKRQQMEIMWARQRESDRLKAELKERNMQQWAWGKQQKIEVRRNVKENMKAIKKGAMRFHPKWGYVPNDLKPQRFGNKLNGKRRKKFNS